MPQYPGAYYAEKAEIAARRKAAEDKANITGVALLRAEIVKCEELLETEADPERIAAYRHRIDDNRRRLAELGQT